MFSVQLSRLSSMPTKYTFTHSCRYRVFTSAGIPTTGVFTRTEFFGVFSAAGKTRVKWIKVYSSDGKLRYIVQRPSMRKEVSAWVVRLG